MQCEGGVMEICNFNRAVRRDPLRRVRTFEQVFENIRESDDLPQTRKGGSDDRGQTSGRFWRQSQ